MDIGIFIQLSNTTLVDKFYVHLPPYHVVGIHLQIMVTCNFQSPISI